MNKNKKPFAQAARGAGFTPAERAGGLGGAPLAPPSSMRIGAGFTPAERAGGGGGAPLAPASSMRIGAGFTPAERAGGRGGREVERSETSADPACTTRRASVAPSSKGGSGGSPQASRLH